MGRQAPCLPPSGSGAEDTAVDRLVYNRSSRIAATALIILGHYSVYSLRGFWLFCVCWCGNACLLRLWHLPSPLLRFLLLLNVLLVKEELLRLFWDRSSILSPDRLGIQILASASWVLWVKVCGHSIQAELVKLGVNDLPAPFKNIEARYGCTCGSAESCARSWSARASLSPLLACTL